MSLRRSGSSDVMDRGPVLVLNLHLQGLLAQALHCSNQLRTNALCYFAAFAWRSSA
jgi:hypothetical protein